MINDQVTDDAVKEAGSKREMVHVRENESVFPAPVS